MSRKPRFILPGIPQHVIQRGNNREPCFKPNRIIGDTGMI
jgi:REP element-mobilizing transposase RayT